MALLVLRAVVAQRMVEMEERIRELEGSAAQQRAVEGRLGALERRLRGAEAGTQVSRSAVDDEVRRLEARVMELTSEVIRARQEANDIKIRYDGAVREVQDAKASGVFPAMCLGFFSATKSASSVVCRLGSEGRLYKSSIFPFVFAVRDLSTQVGQLAQVSSNAMKGSQEISRQRFVTIESTYRELQTQIERQKATMDAMRAEYLDNLTKVRAPSCLWMTRGR